MLASVPTLRGTREKIGQRLSGSIVGEKPIVLQVHREGLQPRSILCPVIHPFRESGHGKLATVGAALDLPSMFGDFNHDGRNVENLSRFIPSRLQLLQRHPACATPFDLMNLHMLRVLHHGQRRSLVPPLPARSLAAGLPFPAELPGQSVAGRRLIAVMAILVDLLSSVWIREVSLSILHQPLNGTLVLILQVLNEGDDRLGASLVRIEDMLPAYARQPIGLFSFHRAKCFMILNFPESPTFAPVFS